jgi:hypothetical protein
MPTEKDDPIMFYSGIKVADRPATAPRFVRPDLLEGDIQECPRSGRRDVRNPVLGLSAAKRILALSPDVRDLLADLLFELARDCQERAQKCWRTHKAPMAVYWKAVGVYAKHIGRAVRA